MKHLWHRVESEKPNCSAIIHAVMDDFGITIKEAIISIPKTYKDPEKISKALKTYGFDFDEIMIDLENKFENEEN
jgi:hypothetical protein